MKNTILFLIIMAISSMSFSQSLTPTVSVNQTDTSFCWSLSQSKSIAKALLSSKYDQQIISLAQARFETSQKALAICKQKEVLYLSKINNLERITINQELNETSYKQRVLYLKRKIKNGRIHKAGLSMLAAFLLFTQLNTSS